MHTAGRIVLFLLEFAVLLGAIFLGSLYGGIAVGFAGGIGVVIMTLFFQLKAGVLPIEVMNIILCVICAIACMQAAGGLDWLVRICERLIRAHPKYITFIAPLVTFVLTVFAGTGHTAFACLPVIAEVAKNVGVRPSRPLSVAVVSSQLAICCSPISAAVVALTSFLEPKGVSYLKILAVEIPAVLVGTLCSSFVANFLGKELVDDPEYTRRYTEGRVKGGPVPRSLVNHTDGENQDICVVTASQEEVQVPVEIVEETAALIKSEPKRAVFGLRADILSVSMFLVALVFIVIYATLISDSAKVIKDPKVGRTDAILSVMLCMAFLIMVACKIDPSSIPAQATFKSGLIAVVCVAGVSWMGDTFISNYLADIKSLAGDVIKSQGWLLSVILFFCSCLLYSQAATTNALYPAALSIGVSNMVAVASFPAVSALFVLPTYPTVIAAAEMDDTGTTKLGKYVFNHPFIIPGIVNIAVSVCMGFLLSLAIIR